MHGVTEALGMLASLSSFILWIPQGRRVWRGRNDPAALEGIALSTQAISLAGNVLWTLYAVGIGSFWLGAPAIVNVPILTMGVVVLRRNARRRGRELATGAASVEDPSVEDASVEDVSVEDASVEDVALAA